MLLMWAGFFCSAVPGLGSGRDPSRQRVFARLEAPLITVEKSVWTWHTAQHFTGAMGMQHSLGMQTRGLFSILLHGLFFGSAPLHALLWLLLQQSGQHGALPEALPNPGMHPFWVPGRGWWLIPVPDHGAVSKAVQSLRAASWCWFGTRAQTWYSCSQQQGPQIPWDWCTSWHFPSPKGCTRELVASGFMACRSRLARLASMVLVRSLSLHCSGILEVCLLFQACHCKMVLNGK